MERFIKTQDEFEQLIEDLKSSEILAIDTEFLREKNYYPKLCLIQINNGEIQALVDSITIHDLTSLADLLTDEKIMKIFHAGSQDVEVLYYATGVSPWPVFDTQLAASLLGYPLQVGYGPLVQSICGVKLAKADSYSDWSKRPLTKSQISYALDDVVYLPSVYKKLRAQLEEKGRLHWLDEDFRYLTDVSRFETDPRKMWRKLKRITSLNRKQLAIARELAAWREEDARARDLPRKRILSDEIIVEISRKAPRAKEQIMTIRGAENLNKRTINKALACVRTALALPPDEYPQLATYPRGEVKLDGVVNLMAAIVELRAHQNDVATPALASKDELTRLAHGHHDDIDVLKGWRFEMVGKELLDLLDGKLSVRVDNDKIAVIHCE